MQDLKVDMLENETTNTVFVILGDIQDFGR